eukprot:7043771-Pyramimonas_sp.AAC.1
MCWCKSCCFVTHVGGSLAPWVNLRQLGWPGLDPVELPPEVSAVQLYSANLFDLGEGGTHVLAKHATKSLAKAATQLQTSVALGQMQVNMHVCVITRLNKVIKVTKRRATRPHCQEGPRFTNCVIPIVSYYPCAIYLFVYLALPRLLPVRNVFMYRCRVQLLEGENTDQAVLAAINATKNFFFYGIQPTKGLDDLDQARTLNINKGVTEGVTAGVTKGVTGATRAACPRSLGALYVYILSPLPRLVPVTGIFYLPFRDWCPPCWRSSDKAAVREYVWLLDTYDGSNKTHVRMCIVNPKT